MKNKWKQFADIIGCAYNIRFQTNGWGDFRVDNNGLYSYENKEYCDGLVGLFISGEIKEDLKGII